uniref:Uncharacterized protein n=1 Tax=Rhizophora mucronata TaxID=61149 RepID=A0A2P2L963_RHIMU
MRSTCFTSEGSITPTTWDWVSLFPRDGGAIDGIGIEGSPFHGL